MKGDIEFLIAQTRRLEARGMAVGSNQDIEQPIPKQIDDGPSSSPEARAETGLSD